MIMTRRRTMMSWYTWLYLYVFVVLLVGGDEGHSSASRTGRSVSLSAQPPQPQQPQLQQLQQSLQAPTGTTGSVSEADYQTLHAFYNATNGAYWVLSKPNPLGYVRWNFTQHLLSAPCTNKWIGIDCFCNTMKMCVIRSLQLSFRNLTGHIPPSIAQFRNVTKLLLDHNVLRGPVPNEIGYMTTLTHLSLNNNFMNGTLPASIANLRHLEILNMSTNTFTGTMPETWFNLSNIGAIDIHFNNITGTLSERIGDLRNISVFRIGVNYFYGTLPLTITQCQNLTQFSIQYNGFVGKFPMLFNEIKTLQALDLSFNFFSGNIPSAFGSGLPNLRDFIVQNNKFTGILNFDFVTLSNLRQLSVSNNFFHGTIPSNLTIMSNLIGITLNNNLFTGTLPESFHQLTKLTGLEVHQNALEGPIQAYINPFFRLILLDLSGCFFTGPLPNASFPVLETLQTFNNFLTGTIPANLQNSHLMVRLYIGQNLISGTVPYWVGEFRILAYLSMESALLTGVIPSTLGDHPIIGQIFLGNNYLRGTIPSNIGNDSRLTELVLSYNQLTGTIPKKVLALPRLQIFQVQSNKLTGTIVDSRTTNVQSKLVNIDLSGNRLSGTLPTNLFYSTTLQSFVASDNCLHGTIPETICNAPLLNSLALDGIGSADACQKRIFAGIPYFTAFSVTTPLTGTIPQCIFAKDGLFSLHLAGNKLEGSFPNNLTIADTLIDLTLAHNILEGSIPESIQSRRWDTLDLSFNRFDGTLMSSFASVPNTSSISLQINRLSGTIPSALTHGNDVTMLSGNIFSCSIDENELPQSDPDANIYSCGSTSIDQSMYIWLGLISAFALFLVILGIYRSDPKEHVDLKLMCSRLFCCASLGWMIKLVDELKAWMAALLEDDGISEEEFVQQHLKRLSERQSGSTKIGPIILPSASIFLFCKFLDSIRFIFFIVSALILLVLMPMYGALTVYSGTYEYQYSWTVSSIFTEGTAAGICYFLGFTGLIALTFLLSDKNIFRMHHSVQKAYDKRKSAIRESIRKSMVERHTLSNRKSQAVSADFSEDDESYEDSYDEDEEQEWYDDDIVDEFKRKWWQITGALVLVALINLIAMILIDILYVIVILDSNDLTVIFTQLGLSFFKIFWNEVVLWKMIPFLYAWVVRCFDKNFDEAKNIFKHYAYRNREISFLIFMVVLNNVIIPCISIAVVSPDCYYNAFFAEPPVSSTTVNGCTYVIDTAFTVTCVGSVVYDEEISYNPPFSYRYQCSSAFATNYTSVYLYMFMIAGVIIPGGKIVLKLIYDRIGMDHWLRPRIDKLLPGSLRDLAPAADENDSHMFKRDKFIVRINSYLTILLSFGAIFPPLAIVAFISTCCITFFEQLLLGRLLFEAKQKKLEWYKRKVAEDCNGTSKSWFRSLWIITPFACFGYSIVLLDTFGGKYGWRIGLIPALLMFCLPFIIWFFRGVYRYFKPIQNKSSSKDKEVWLELMLINIGQKLAISTERSARNSKTSNRSDSVTSTEENVPNGRSKPESERKSGVEDIQGDAEDEDGSQLTYFNPIRALSAKIKAEKSNNSFSES